MRLYIINYTRKAESIRLRRLDLTDRVAEVKTKIQEKEGIPVGQQRLVFDGNVMEDERTLSHYDIENDSTLHLIPRNCGMMGAFTSNDMSDPLIQYLMGRQDDIPLEHLQARAKEEKASDFQTFLHQQNGEILSSAHRARICAFMNFMWTHTNSDESPRVDMRLVVPDERLLAVLRDVEVVADDKESLAVTVLEKLQQAFQKIPGVSGEPKIALRQTRGPTGACIQFHCNGLYATGTAQIALNEPSEYQGGRLVFFVNDQLHVLERQAGSLVQHPPNILHGVTSLTSGVCQSLFVVDKVNDHGEEGIVEVTKEHVTSFLESLKPRAGDCVICWDRTATHVLVPCGHLCLCEQCVGKELRSCPRCRGKITGKTKVFF